MSTDTEIIKDFLQQTDFVMLKEQVLVLSQLEERLMNTDPKSAEVISGVLNFLNNLRDEVADSGLIPENYVFPEDEKSVVTWPDCQVLMDHPDFQRDAELINDEYGLNLYGSSAYWVPNRIIQSC